jgi:hypothetical protein
MLCLHLQLIHRHTPNLRNSGLRQAEMTLDVFADAKHRDDLHQHFADVAPGRLTNQRPGAPQASNIVNASQ